MIKLTDGARKSCQDIIADTKSSRAILAQPVVLTATEGDNLYEFSIPAGSEIYQPPTSGSPKKASKQTKEEAANERIVLVFFPEEAGREPHQLSIRQGGEAIPKGMARYTEKTFATKASSIEQVRRRFA